MLDGLKRGKPGKHLEVIKKPKPEISPVDKKRFIDTFKIRRANRIKISDVEKSNGRIRLKRSPEKLRRKKWVLVWSSSVIIFLVVCAVVFSQTRAFKVALLITRIKNQSIIVGFQNSAELRPTGGFWGSFALLEVKKNLAKSNLYFETNPYKKNQKFANNSKELPTPVKQTWPDKPTGFVNAAWSVDFPEAAKTIEWYFGEGWDKKTDGVVAISSLSLIDLLRLTGTITLDDQTQISAENFTQVMSQKIDTEYWLNPENKQANEPKAILKDIAPQIINRAKSLPRLTLYKFLFDQMSKGRILVYFNDNRQQALAEEAGISGKILPYKEDFLSINNANLNGGKTSLNIEQTIKYSISGDKSRPEARLEISRSYPSHEWPDILNRNYTRVIAPLGSRLLSAQLNGSDITNNIETLDESGRTTFGFWFSVSPTETKTATLEYELPFSLNNSRDYNLILQKQPGTRADKVNVSVFDRVIFNKMFDQNFLEIR